MAEPAHHARHVTPQDCHVNWRRTVLMDNELEIKDKKDQKRLRKNEGIFLNNPPSKIALLSACPTHISNRTGKSINTDRC